MADMSFDLHRFLRATVQAPWVWARRRVRPLPHGQVPDVETQADGAALLPEALAEAYGAAAADQSRQVLAAQQVAPGRPMASSLVGELAACAEDASSLFDGQRFVLCPSLSTRMEGGLPGGLP